MGPTDILTRVFAIYGNDGHFNTRFCLIWVRRTFLHAFLPYMVPTEFLTRVFALYGTDGILTRVFALYGTNGHFNTRYCLIWYRRTF